MASFIIRVTLAQAAIATEICDIRNVLDLAGLADAVEAPLLKSYCQQVSIANLDAILVECGPASLADCDPDMLAELEVLISPHWVTAPGGAGGAAPEGNLSWGEAAARLRLRRERWRRRGAWGLLPTAGTNRYCTPRPPAHGRPSSRELNGIT